MIDFACKKFELEEVIKCGLGLTKSDYRIFEFFMRNARSKEFGSVEIARSLSLDVSTVQRALKRLSEKNIILRSQKNLNNGGYVFIYRINERSIIKKIILDVVHNWVKKVEVELERW
jgi:predicted transcriptional regulator